MFPAGEGSSDNSDDSTAKKHTADLTTPFDKPYVDTWRPEYDQKFYRQSADYDELNYPSRVGVEIYSWKIQYLFLFVCIRGIELKKKKKKKNTVSCQVV